VVECDPGILTERLLSSPGVTQVLSVLSLVSEESVLMGGAVRDAVLDHQRAPHDLDFVVSRSALDSLRRLRLPNVEVRENRHGNPRLVIAGMQVDVFAPQTFFKSFDSVEDVLAYCDVNINAIGLCLSNSEIYDPLNGLDALAARRCTLVEPRWHDHRSGPEAAVLRARLILLLRRYPLIVCTNPAVALTDCETIMLQSPAVVAKYLDCAPDAATVELRRTVGHLR
jgi:hypothetical protein